MAILTVYTKLLDQTLDGARIIDMGSTKTCQCYVLPYDKVYKVGKKYISGKFAFYILLGKNEYGNPKAYIGQTNDFVSRSNDHKQKKEWWDSALVFVSKADEIFASEVQYLEFLGWKLATEACNYEIANTKQIKEPRLSDDKKNDMELFFEEIKFLTKFYGCNIFNVASTPSDDSDEDDHVVLYLRMPKTGVDATVFYYPKEECFILKAGSKIKYEDSDSGSRESHEKREQIKKDEQLSRRQGDLLEILKDVDITSRDKTPSGAACVITGGSVQGTIVLKDKDGIAFADLFKDKSQQ